MNHDIDQSRSLLDAAQAAAGAQEYPRGTLYVVATPIGNLADSSLRAIHVLSLVDAVACEDTRVTGALLSHLGLQKPLLAAHEHNEREAAGAVVERLRRDERVALVSDAGTPAVSDPGAKLVAEVVAAGLRVVPVPGVSAVVAATSVAGVVSGDGGFRFVGFAPAKGAPRRERLAEWVREATTVVLYESPHRIEQLAQELSLAAPERRVTIARELTKQFESIVTMPASEMPGWLAADRNHQRGEFVLVLHPVADDKPATSTEVDTGTQRLLAVLLRELPLKQAVRLAAQATDTPRNALYEAALALRAMAADGQGDVDPTADRDEP